MAYKRCWRAY